MHGMEGVRYFTRIKTTTTRWHSGQRTTQNSPKPREEKAKFPLGLIMGT